MTGAAIPGVAGRSLRSSSFGWHRRGARLGPCAPSERPRRRLVASTARRACCARRARIRTRIAARVGHNISTDRGDAPPDPTCKSPSRRGCARLELSPASLDRRVGNTRSDPRIATAAHALGRTSSAGSATPSRRAGPRRGPRGAPRSSPRTCATPTMRDLASCTTWGPPSDVARGEINSGRATATTAREESQRERAGEGREPRLHNASQRTESSQEHCRPGSTWSSVRACARNRRNRSCAGIRSGRVGLGLGAGSPSQHGLRRLGTNIRRISFRMTQPRTSCVHDAAMVVGRAATSASGRRGTPRGSARPSGGAAHSPSMRERCRCFFFVEAQAVGTAARPRSKLRAGRLAAREVGTAGLAACPVRSTDSVTAASRLPEASPSRRPRPSDPRARLVAQAVESGRHNEERDPAG